MASRSNPNLPSKQRRIASRAKVQRRNAINKVTQKSRGTTKSSVLLPTSGPGAALSKKKARKLERAQKNTRRRAIEQAMEKEGEVEMTDAPKTTKPKAKKETDDTMKVDEVA